MKEVKLPSGEYLLVDYPIGSISFGVWEVQNGFTKVGKKGDCVISYKPLMSEFVHKVIPPGQWAIIGKADALTEYQWKGIVEVWSMVHGGAIPSYKCYTGEYAGYVNNPTLSGKSLLTHHGYELNKTIILKKEL